MKEFRLTGNLNTSNTKMIMADITPHIEMRSKVIYSFNQRFIGVLVRLLVTARH